MHTKEMSMGRFEVKKLNYIIQIDDVKWSNITLKAAKS